MPFRIHLPGLAPLMLGLALAVMGLLIVMPLGVVFTEAFAKGASTYLASFNEPDLWAAIDLTLMVAAISVPLNAIFGVAAAWSIAKFEFRGKSLLLAIIDLPFSMSAVASNMIWVLLFSTQRLFAHSVTATDSKTLQKAKPASVEVETGHGPKTLDSLIASLSYQPRLFGITTF
jgi:sulfate transport system permease protein